MKYKFVIMDRGNPKEGILPLNGIVQIQDNTVDDNTEEWKKHLHEFYEEEGFETTVITEKEYIEKNKKR